MELEYRASFVRDLRRVGNAEIRRRLERTMGHLEAAGSIADIAGAVRIRSATGRYFRIRIGDYRLGLALEGDTVILVRFLHRREIYRMFP